MKITNFSCDFFETVNKIDIFFIFSFYDHGCYQGMITIWKKKKNLSTRPDRERTGQEEIKLLLEAYQVNLPPDFQMKVF